jgi:uncharacterized protein CbrC (UPF0167 family)
MVSISVPAAIAISTAASGAIGAGASIYGANKAASSADKAANLQRQQYGQTRADLEPYFAPGQEAVTNALSLAQSGPTGGGPDYTALAYKNLPGNMTQEQLEQTPGYQFTRDQGLKSVQSAAAARGLGVSGAALKGAAEYATGLANKTYLDQFNVRQKQFDDYINLNTGQQGNLQNQFSRLNSIATLGANAAAGLGTQGTSAANNAGGYINASGLDTAGGLNNAVSGVNSGVNNYLAYNAYQNRTNGPSNALQPGTSGYTPPYNPNVNMTLPANMQ